MKRIVCLLVLTLCINVCLAQTIDWYVDNQIYQTTTCENGSNVTPPTPPEKYGYHFTEWRKLYIGTVQTTSTNAQAAIITLNVNGTKYVFRHTNSPINIDGIIRVSYTSPIFYITNISQYKITVGSRTINPGGSFSWTYTQSVNYRIDYSTSNFIIGQE